MSTTPAADKDDRVRLEERWKQAWDAQRAKWRSDLIQWLILFWTAEAVVMIPITYILLKTMK